MLNFVICNGNRIEVKKIELLVDQIMGNIETEYQKHIFSNYNAKFEQYIKIKNGLRIYLLAIETDNFFGFKVAQIIRQTDFNSVIIFLMPDELIGMKVLTGDFLSLTSIIKKGDYLEKLRKAIMLSLKIINCRQNLTFKMGINSYRFLVDDICYIYRETLSRKCVIVTEYTKLFVRKPLCFFEQKLASEFVKTHRACLVNSAKILKYDKGEKVIVLCNGQRIDLVSNIYKGFIV